MSKCVLCGSESSKQMVVALVDGKTSRGRFYDEELEGIPNGQHVFCVERKGCRIRILQNVTGGSNGHWKDQARKSREKRGIMEHEIC